MKSSMKLLSYFWKTWKNCSLAEVSQLSQIQLQTILQKGERWYTFSSLNLITLISLASLSPYFLSILSAFSLMISIRHRSSLNSLPLTSILICFLSSCPLLLSTQPSPPTILSIFSLPNFKSNLITHSCFCTCLDFSQLDITVQCSSLLALAFILYALKFGSSFRIMMQSFDFATQRWYSWVDDETSLEYLNYKWNYEGSLSFYRAPASLEMKVSSSGYSFAFIASYGVSLIKSLMQILMNHLVSASESPKGIKVLLSILFHKSIKVSLGHSVAVWGENAAWLNMASHNSEVFSRIMHVFLQFLVLVLLCLDGVLGLLQLLYETLYGLLLTVNDVHQNQFLFECRLLPF